MLRVLLRNIVANWVGYAFQVLVTFFLTPFVLHTLGDVRYGAWALVMGMTGYYGLLDLGFRAGMTQYMTRYLATKEYDKLNQTASTGMTVMTLSGCLVASASLIVCWLAPVIFDFPSESVTEIRYGILIVGVFSAGQFPFYCFSAALTAAQRYDLINAIGITTRLVSAALTVFLLKAGHGLVGIALAALAADVVSSILRWQAARISIPELRVSFGRFNRPAFAEFSVYGIWNVLIAGSRRLISYSDAIVIGLFLPVAAIAPYALAASLVQYFNRLIMPISRVLFPAATKLDAEGDTDGLSEMYLTGSRLLLSLAVLTGTIAFVWAEDFFRLWVGEQYVGQNEYASSSLIFRILVLSAIITAGQRVGYQILLGARQVRTLAMPLAFEAVANVILSCIAAPIWGLPGVAAATLVTTVAIQLLVLPVLNSLHLKIDLFTAFVAVYARPLLLSAFVFVFASMIRANTSQPDLWWELGLLGGASFAVCFPGLLLICFRTEEFQRLIGQPTARLVTRCQAIFARVR